VVAVVAGAVGATDCVVVVVGVSTEMQEANTMTSPAATLRRSIPFRLVEVGRLWPRVGRGPMMQ